VISSISVNPVLTPTSDSPDSLDSWMFEYTGPNSSLIPLGPDDLLTSSLKLKILSSALSII